MNEQRDTVTAVSGQIQEKKFIRGDYGLGFTFWGTGFGGTVVLISFITVILNTIGNETVAFFAMALFFIYSVIISIAIWRASNQYKTSPGWPALAKISVIIVSGFILIVYLYLLAYLTADYPNH